MDTDTVVVLVIGVATVMVGIVGIVTKLVELGRK